MESHYSLEQLFDKFQTKDILDQENLWYCRNCKEHVKAEKTI